MHAQCKKYSPAGTDDSNMANAASRGDFFAHSAIRRNKLTPVTAQSKCNIVFSLTAVGYNNVNTKEFYNLTVSELVDLGSSCA